jgi:hypothetical protein
MEPNGARYSSTYTCTSLKFKHQYALEQYVRTRVRVSVPAYVLESLALEATAYRKYQLEYVLEYHGMA